MSPFIVFGIGCAKVFSVSECEHLASRAKPNQRVGCGQFGECRRRCSEQDGVVMNITRNRSLELYERET